MSTETLFHATTASNFGKGYDRYSRTYDKSRVPSNRHPGKFFLLRREDIPLGVERARALVAKLGLPGDQVVVMQTRVASQQLHANLTTGIGRYLETSVIEVDAVFRPLDVPTGFEMMPLAVEEVQAVALRALHPVLAPYERLAPRTLSVLPVARACQAACRFCFSEGSTSLEQRPAPVDLEPVNAWCQEAAARGAERFVVTGGGEPGVLPHDQLCALLAQGSRYFRNTVLITNGVHLSRAGERMPGLLKDYAQCGLRTLSVSRHHHDDAHNFAIMGIHTHTEQLARAWREGLSAWPHLRLRLVCVLQKEGIQDEPTLRAYLNWAASLGVEEVCFKELYVSTTLESQYHDRAVNAYSQAHQVPLSMLVRALQEWGFVQAQALPWGSPVFSGRWADRPMRIAAYTEPSLFWERSNGVCRSWNLMADRRCLASLEDPASEVGLGRSSSSTTPERRPRALHSRTIPLIPLA